MRACPGCYASSVGLDLVLCALSTAGGVCSTRMTWGIQAHEVLQWHRSQSLLETNAKQPRNGPCVRTALRADKRFAGLNRRWRRQPVFTAISAPANVMADGRGGHESVLPIRLLQQQRQGGYNAGRAGERGARPNQSVRT